jgi:hypothetical protein
MESPARSAVDTVPLPIQVHRQSRLIFNSCSEPPKVMKTSNLNANDNVIVIVPQSKAEVLLRQYAKATREGNITSNGVVYRWWLEGRDGAGFKLFRESHHTDCDLKQAQDELRRQSDVVVLDIVTIETAPMISNSIPK